MMNSTYAVYDDVHYAVLAVQDTARKAGHELDHSESFRFVGMDERDLRNEMQRRIHMKKRPTT
jgi:hypothetical protein